jgi:hypothetical protein
VFDHTHDTSQAGDAVFVMDPHRDFFIITGRDLNSGCPGHPVGQSMVTNDLPAESLCIADPMT